MINNFINKKNKIENVKEIELEDIFNMDSSKNVKCKGPINYMIWEKIHNELNKNYYDLLFCNLELS